MRLFVLCVGVALLLVLPSPAEKPNLKKTPMDEAVEKACEFLKNTQKSDGSWTAGRQGSHVGVSALAVMAFLSAGHVPGEGKYGKAITKGVEWVVSQQKTNGLLASDNGHEMYHHGIATLMLAEVCGMMNKEKGKEIRRSVEKAVLLILKAQRTSGSSAGGWRYSVAHTAGSDMSVTGWQIMALRAAKNLGCDVPAKTIENAVKYIKGSQNSLSGGFSYTPGGNNVTIPCTGTGILALELCGKDEHKSAEVLKAGAYLVRTNNLPKWGNYHFFYSVYYGAQATFQLGGNYWSAYRTRLHFALLRNQGSTGSWLGQTYEANYGPNYCTAMAVLALTVEYRFLPIYQRGDEANEREK